MHTNAHTQSLTHCLLHSCSETWRWVWNIESVAKWQQWHSFCGRGGGMGWGTGMHCQRHKDRS